MSNAQPSLPALGREPDEIRLARLALAAAYQLYECEQEAAKLGTDSAEGFRNLIAMYPREQAIESLARFRYATGLSDVLAAILNDTEETETVLLRRSSTTQKKK
jgi:hypothetical protein